MVRYMSVVSQPRGWIGYSWLFAGLLAGVQGLDCMSTSSPFGNCDRGDDGDDSDDGNDLD